MPHLIPRRAFLALAGALVAYGLVAAPAQATFPGQPGKIAYVSSSQDRDLTVDLRTGDLGGAIERSVFSGTAVRIEGPSWSPRGTKLAFTSDRDATSDTIRSDEQLFTVSRDGTGLTQVTSTPVIARASGAAWGPGGHEIAFAGSRVINGTRNIFAATPDGAGLRQITHTGGITPDWSSRNRISYAFGARVYVMRPDGTHRLRVSRPGTRCADPSWSPRGTKLVMSCRVQGNTDIYAVGADGHGLRRLTRAPGNDTDPVWSPDGRLIAFVRAPTAGLEIVAMRADGTHLRRSHLGGGSLADISAPAWQPR